MAQINNPLNMDEDVYDSMPEGVCQEDYDTGYITCVFFTLPPFGGINTKNWFTRTNCKALVRTSKFAEPPCIYPYEMIYAIHETPFEQDLFCRILKKYNYLYEVMNNGEPGYYHIYWNLHFFKHNKFDTPGKRCRAEIEALFIKDLEQRKQIRKKYMLEKGCYVPESNRNPTCKSNMGVNFQICARCPLSRYYDRYKNGKCIRKLPKNKRKTPERRKKNKG